MSAPAPSWLDDRCAGLVAQVRESWGWLALLVEPGRESRSAPVLSDRARARLAMVVRDERADRAEAAGLGALAPAAAAARLGVLDAQQAVRRLVVEAAQAAAEALDAVYVGQDGPGAVDAALSWLDGGRPVWVATQSSILGCAVRPRILDELHLTALAVVASRLARAHTLARAAAGIDGEEAAPFPAPCPACRRRSLEWQMPTDNRQTWHVLCVSEACRCSGPGCPCRQRVRYAGRRHAWSAGEIDGPWGLLAAAAAARSRPARIRSAAAGHGAWPSTRRGETTITVDGVDYTSQAALLEQLGPDVTAAMMRYWARSRGITRVHIGRDVWWPRQAILDAELATRVSRRGRRRRAEDHPD